MLVGKGPSADIAYTLLRKMVPQADIFVGHTGNAIRKIEP